MPNWIPLMDYAMKKGVSLSTLRRHIKANKIEHRVENGRYLILDQELDQRMGEPAMRQGTGATARDLSTKTPASTQATQVSALEQELKNANEEIAELKMLVALYEDKLFSPKLNS